MGQFLGQFWAQKTKQVPFFFKIVDFLLLFVRIVIRCFDWFNHFYRLSGIFKNQILYLDLFLGQIWAKLWTQKAKKQPKTTLPNHWFSIAFVSIVIWSFKIYNWFINYFHQVFWGIQNSKLIFHFWTYSWAKSGPNLNSEDKKPADISFSKLWNFYCFCWYCDKKFQDDVLACFTTSTKSLGYSKFKHKKANKMSLDKILTACISVHIV